MEVSQSTETIEPPTSSTVSSTTVAPRVVGDPLSTPVLLGSGVALFVAIVGFGVVMRRKQRKGST